MAPKGKNSTNPTKGKARAMREAESSRRTEEHIRRLPDPDPDSDFEPDPEDASEPGEESNQEAPADKGPLSFRTIPCVPCLKRMVKVPLNGRPEPCISRDGKYTACQFCAVKSLGCKSPGDYVHEPLKQWDNRKRSKFVKEFTDLALDVQIAAQAILKNEEVEEDWGELTDKVQEFIDEVGVEKAKQEAHEAKKKYEALREEVDSIWAKLKEIDDWIEKKARLFLSQDEDDEMFIRFMAAAMLLEEKNPKKFQKMLDLIRGVSKAGNDSTGDDDADEEEEEEEQQECSSGGGGDDDVSMVSE
ncbi:hypothetical protein FMUND_13506 [Fusarium mundagurra]|uniref:Uncharacterized protein n=1 Tax=Fusarium mundagurra TaxID=1567541 RepID=A0A8H5XYI3_9HYPO|nr:hypothetical protein FMUND_13506 [Fusarium mundagurra]